MATKTEILISSLETFMYQAKEKQRLWDLGKNVKCHFFVCDNTAPESLCCV